MCVLMTVCFSVVLVQPRVQGLLVRSQHVGHTTGAAKPPVPAPKSPTSGRESLALWWLWRGSARPTARSAKHHIHASAPAFQRVPNLM